MEALPAAVDVLGAHRGLAAEGDAREGSCGEYLRGPRAVFRGDVWAWRWNVLGKGDPAVPTNARVQRFGRARPLRLASGVRNASGWPSAGRRGYPFAQRRGSLLEAVDGWRRARRVPMQACARWGGFRRGVGPAERGRTGAVVPAELHAVRGLTSVSYRPDAWFSGSMNYLGRARRPTACRVRGPPTRSTRRWRFGAGVRATGDPRGSAPGT